MNALVIGAGISGVTAARLLAESGYKVLIVDKRNSPGGLLEDNIGPYGYYQLYGPHIFHTKDSEVATFLARFTTIVLKRHYVYAKVEWNNFRKYYELPVKAGFRIPDTFEELLEFLNNYKPLEIDKIAIQKLGRDTYNLFFRPYSLKMWGEFFDELDPNLFSRVGLRTDRHSGYFTDDIVGFPASGFSKVIERILDHPNITFRGRTVLTFKDISLANQLVFSSAYTPKFFDYEYGDLKQRAIKFILGFERKHEEAKFPVVNYTFTEIFTRKTYFHNFDVITDRKSDFTYVMYELPYTPRNGEVGQYIVPTSENKKVIEKYRALAKENNIILIGRLGLMQYLNIDQAIRSAMDAVQPFLKS